MWPRTPGPHRSHGPPGSGGPARWPRWSERTGLSVLKLKQNSAFKCESLIRKFIKTWHIRIN